VDRETRDKNNKMTAPPKKANRLSRQLILISIFIVLSVCVYILVLKPVPPQTVHSNQPSANNNQVASSKTVIINKKTTKDALGSVIKAIHLTPSQPTRLDTLKAEIELQPGVSSDGLSYQYDWKVNHRSIANTNKDSLELSGFQKNDLLSVRVTPYNEEGTGFSVESSFIAIHSIPPSLELQRTHQNAHSGKVFMQLVSIHPDSDKVRLGLAEPFISGMTIDSQNGKITWIIQPEQKGVIRFGASVEDEDKTVKVTKIFEMTID